MNEIVTRSTGMIALPAPKVEISIRLGTLADVEFIDQLQSKTTKMVGWMPRKQIEGKIGLGHVLVAWTARPCAAEDMGETPMVREERLGYVIGNDQYFKRDDVGIIYALNVVPGSQRKLIGASLIKAMFERAAYGCRLFCCWCAQDIDANYFWESIGFVPIAFRAGSRGKGRVHIFWQKRIREGDTTTPYWFPCQTSGGAIREDRLVLPIPPGTHWKDAKPIVLPGDCRGDTRVAQEGETSLAPTSACSRRACSPSSARGSAGKPANYTETKKVEDCAFGMRGLRFDPPKPAKSGGRHSEKTPKAERQPRPKTHRVKVKNDPRYVAAARELRDRWMEEVQSGRLVIESQGKYDVGRMIEASAVQIVPALPAAA